MSKHVLVCGGRSYADAEKVNSVLAAFDPAPDVIMQGGASGADYLARRWARHNSVFVMNYPADWNRLGLQAGPRRNQQMLDEGKPDIVIVFAGGKGTADMTQRAKRAGIPVTEIPA